MSQLSADEIVRLLGLEPLPGEGGWFRETYKAAGRRPTPMGERSHSTQIYYMLRSGSASKLHRVRSDEVFHHYMGSAVTQLLILPEGDAEVVHIGQDLAAGERPQAVVPAGVWQGACLTADLEGEPDAGAFALMGCTVAPGFEWEDFELISDEQAASLRGRAGVFGDLFDRLS